MANIKIWQSVYKISLHCQSLNLVILTTSPNQNVPSPKFPCCVFVLVYNIKCYIISMHYTHCNVHDHVAVERLLNELKVVSMRFHPTHGPGEKTAYNNKSILTL